MHVQVCVCACVRVCVVWSVCAALGDMTQQCGRPEGIHEGHQQGPGAGLLPPLAHFEGPPPPLLVTAQPLLGPCGGCDKNLLRLMVALWACPALGR